MPQYRPFSRATWSIYLFLLAFRAFIAISPGYIHPDEFFQSAEITAGMEEPYWFEVTMSLEISLEVLMLLISLL